MTDRGYTDAAPWLNGAYRSDSTYRGVKRSSRYLTMSDGVKIAIDIYIPKGLSKDAKLPTLVHQTRYYRRFKYQPLLLPVLLRRDQNWQEIKRLVKNGYALVNVDVRGTGASFGSREMEFSPDEIKDGAEIVDWIIEQDWSNGLVGTFGTSYTGSTAEFLLTNHHPAVKAAAIRYANFDAFTDVVCPGGVRNRGFLKTWSSFDHALDNGQLPQFIGERIGRMGKIAVRGVPAVDGRGSKKLLQQAIHEHKDNYDIYESAKQVEFRDDASESGLTLDQFSPHTLINDVESSGTPIYNWSGWYDGGFTLSTVKRFMNIRTPGSRLILGPWDHGGRQNPDPRCMDHESEFDHTGEMLRFFDCYLKGVDNGIQNEDAVRYYTMGEGAWKSAPIWPPGGFIPTPFYFSDSKTLSVGVPPEDNGSDDYQVDFYTSSGKTSRWVSLININEVGIDYPDRAEQDARLLVYQSAALKRDVEMTGHPLITLYIRSNTDDGQFFAYLEDVTRTGEVIYVTEGQFRASHRAICQEKPLYHAPIIHHTYKREDAMPLVPGEVATLSFDLQPVSYLFRKGHSIRLAIAGADRDNFALLSAEGPQIEVLWGAEHPSHIVLPIQWR
jgi:putative CocE/NonD family hydrolase